MIRHFLSWKSLCFTALNDLASHLCFSHAFCSVCANNNGVNHTIWCVYEPLILLCRCYTPYRNRLRAHHYYFSTLLASYTRHTALVSSATRQTSVTSKVYRQHTRCFCRRKSPKNKRTWVCNEGGTCKAEMHPNTTKTAARIQRAEFDLYGLRPRGTRRVIVRLVLEVKAEVFGA